MNQSLLDEAFYLESAPYLYILIRYRVIETYQFQSDKEIQSMCLCVYISGVLCDVWRVGWCVVWYVV